jgi:heat shock protein HtpX
MERAPFGRDLGLSFRLAACLALLACLYLPFIAWFVGMTYLISRSGFATALVLAGSLLLLGFVPSLSKRLALSGTEDLDPTAESRVRPLIERLCGMADLPVPRLALLPNSIPNAFSAGGAPRKAVIVVTRGLLEALDDEELGAVLAHELAHVANRDAAVMTVAAAPAMLARKVVWGLATLPFTVANIPGKVLAGFLVLYLLPLLLVGWISYALATLLVMSISRYREYVADRDAALVTGTPEQLMSALQRISGEVALIPAADLRAVSRLNALFVVPARRADGFEVDPLHMFPTHPPLERRLARLSALAETVGSIPGSESPAPVAVGNPHAPRADNPRALVALFLACIFWGVLVAANAAARDLEAESMLWIGVVGSASALGGIVLGFQGVGRASAGASGMGYAVAALALLLGPWVLGTAALVVVAGLGALGIGPFT